jgi:serine protease AprX
VSDRRTRFPLWLAAVAATVALLAVPVGAAGGPAGQAKHSKLDKTLQRLAASNGQGDARVIVELVDNAPAGVIKGLGGREGRRLHTFRGQVARISSRRLTALANSPWVKSVHDDRPVSLLMNRTAVMVGARAVQTALGYDGTGVGVAIIDSGITAWHDDLIGDGIGGQKVVEFVDFVNNQPRPYDDNGHGTHVAGIIAGSGYDSDGARAGIAPGAHLVSLKVLDASGGGHISDVIAALDWIAQNHATYNIRVVNLSVGAGITESYTTDPLTLATKRVVDSGVVVVAAAGNVGKNAAGQIQYGGITAPGNAPWVLTVGASSHMGTLTRTDDTVADYSSRGPTAIDYLAKPDLVAPGTGIVSLSDPNSTFYSTQSAFLLDGTRATSYHPYLSLTGTSMATPVVAGSVALMLQANPALTPNAVKAILEYTAENRPQYNRLTEGAGFLNAKGAVDLANFFRHVLPGQPFPKDPTWSRQIVWGNHVLGGGMILPTASAWADNIVWGAARDAAGYNIVCGTACPDPTACDNIVWGSSRDGENIVWGSNDGLDNIVWGTSDGSDNIVWGTSDGTDNIVWGTAADGDNIVWGTAADSDNIVWGSDCGGADCDNIVWGSSDSADNIVWGTAAEGDNIVWGSSGDADNIVWGNAASDENIVWGAAADDNIVWGSSSGDNIVWGASTTTDPLFAALDPAVTSQFTVAFFESLFLPPPPPAPDPPPAPLPTQPVTCSTTTTLADGTTVTTTTSTSADGTTTTTTTTTLPDGTTTTTTATTPIAGGL